MVRLRTYLLVGFIGKDNIIQGKYDGADVPQPFLANIHGSSEACIQPSDDPSRTVVRGSILKRVIITPNRKKKGRIKLTRRARGSGAVQGCLSIAGISNRTDQNLPPSPISLSALRIAYTAVKVLTMICHGVKQPREVEKRMMLR